MAYSIDADNIRLGDLMKRIIETDLVPSRVSLLNGIEQKMKVFEGRGITTLTDLRNELKSPKRMETLSQETNIDIQYLTLLRREIESYFPKPFTLKEFSWLQKDAIEKLGEAGIRNTRDLYQAANLDEGLENLTKSTKVDIALLSLLVQMAGLTRVQWVNPTVARMLVEISCDDVTKLAAADADELCESIERVNENGKYFKGRIGLRDIKRLIRAAGYLVEA